MHHNYDLYSWSKQRHEEALREARIRGLARQARANRRPASGQAGASLTRWSVLSLLRGVGLSE